MDLGQRDHTGSGSLGAFALRSGLVFLVVGLLARMLVASVVTENFRDRLDDHAAFVSRTVIAPLLMAEGATDWMAGPLQQRIEEQVAIDEQVLSIAVSVGNAVIAGSDPAMVGGPVTDLADPVDGIVTVTAADDTGTVVRVVQDWTPFRTAAARLLRTLDLTVALGLLGLWALLLPTVHRQGRRLARRSQELEEQGQELRRLLASEHETVERLEELRRLRDGVMTAVSHEVRTPLTIVRGSLETIGRRGAALTPETEAALRASAIRGTIRLELLLDGLLDLETTTHGVRPTQVDLARVGRAVWSEHGGDPTALVLDLETPHVVTDDAILRRVLGHLFANALRHGAPPVHLISTATATGAQVCVLDHGPGIPDRHKDDVFEPLHQGELVDAHAPGLGIGLTRVARDADQLGGRCWVTDGPDGGAYVHVDLPGSASVSAPRAAPSLPG